MGAWSLNNKKMKACLISHGEWEEYKNQREVVIEAKLKKEPDNEKSKFITANEKMKILKGMGYVEFKKALYKEADLPSEKDKPENVKARGETVKTITATPPKSVKSKDLMEWAFHALEDPDMQDDNKVVARMGYGGLGYLKALKNYPKIKENFYTKYIDRMTAKEEEANKLTDDGRVLTKTAQLLVGFAEKSESNNGKLARCLKLLSTLLTSVDTEQAKEINEMLEEK
jgi:hypothetical protein